MATTGAIELIPQEIEAVKARTRTTRKIQLVTFTIFLIAAAASAGLFLFKQSLASNLDAFTAQSATHEATIAQYSDIETKVIGLQSRSTLIAQIITTRDNFSKILAAEELSRPSTLTLAGVSMKKDDPIVTLGGEVADYNVLSTFLTNLIDPQKGGTLFTQAALTSVNLDTATGGINFTVEVITKTGGLKGSLSETQ